VIEMRVRNQHHVDGRQVANTESGSADAFQQKQPTREVWIDQNALPAHLHEKRSVADEGHAQFAVADERWLVGTACAGSDRRVADQSSELLCPLAQSWIS